MTVVFVLPGTQRTIFVQCQHVNRPAACALAARLEQACFVTKITLSQL